MVTSACTCSSKVDSYWCLVWDLVWGWIHHFSPFHHWLPVQPSSYYFYYHLKEKKRVILKWITHDQSLPLNETARIRGRINFILSALIILCMSLVGYVEFACIGQIVCEVVRVKPYCVKKCSTFGTLPTRNWISLTIFFFSCIRAWYRSWRWVSIFSRSDCHNKQGIMGRSEIGKFSFTALF